MAKSFALSEAEDIISGPLNRGGIADLPLLRTLSAVRQKSQELSLWEVTDFFCFISISKFGSFKDHFATITSPSEFNVRCRRLIVLVQTKETISMSYGSSTSS